MVQGEASVERDAVDKAAANKAAVENDAADKTAVEMAAADQSAAEKAAADKAATDKPAVEDDHTLASVEFHGKIVPWKDSGVFHPGFHGNSEQ